MCSLPQGFQTQGVDCLSYSQLQISDSCARGDPPDWPVASQTVISNVKKEVSSLNTLPAMQVLPGGRCVVM